MMKVSRELRGGATQSPEALNLARERSGGSSRMYAATDVPVTGPSWSADRALTLAGTPWG